MTKNRVCLPSPSSLNGRTSKCPKRGPKFEPLNIYILGWSEKGLKTVFDRIRLTLSK